MITYPRFVLGGFGIVLGLMSSVGSANTAFKDIFSLAIEELNELQADDIYLVPILEGDFHGNDPFDDSTLPRPRVNKIGYLFDKDAGTFLQMLKESPAEVGSWDMAADFSVVLQGCIKRPNFNMEVAMIDNGVIVRWRRNGKRVCDAKYGSDFHKWVSTRIVALGQSGAD